MKSFRRLSLGYFVALAATVLFTATVEAVPNKAVVRAIRGDAQMSNNKGQTWSKAKVGASVGANTLLKTPKQGSVDLFLGENGPVVRITEDTIMGIDKLDLENTGIERVIETQLDLKNGRILGNVKKLAAASKYEVKTPVGVAGIRGTEYSISSSGVVNVVSGTVVVVYVINGVVIPPIVGNTGQQISPPVNAQSPPILSTVDATIAGDVAVLVVNLQYINGQYFINGVPQTNPNGGTNPGTTGTDTTTTTTTTTSTTDAPTTTTTLPPNPIDLTEIEGGDGGNNDGNNGNNNPE